MASTTEDRPDLGLPLLGKPFEQESELNTAADWFASPLTVRERSMIGLMLALKDKPEWDRKVFDEEIVAKWRKEALDFKPEVKYVRNSEGETPWDSSDHNGENLNVDGEARQKVVSEEMFDWCIAELRDNATQFQERGFTQAIDANACVYMSDGAVTPGTKAKLREGAERLENVHDWQKDWHPGSDGKVLDLVHPSLFPLLYGRSRILASGEVPLEKCAWSTGEGILFPKPKRPEDVTSYDVYSENFQWLPCQAILDSEGKVKITSYINNLYPSGNEDLYAAIEDVMAASVPLWIETILSTQFLTTHRIKYDFGDGRVLPQEVVERRRREAEERARRLQEDGEYESDGHDYDSEDDYVADIPRLRKFKPRRRVNKSVFEIGQGNRLTGDVDVEMKDPSIEPTEEQLEEGQKNMETEAVNIREVFQDPDHGLQVIVKLANIHLTPEKPTYDGGSWHIEGQENEHIIASALYYYDSENITDSYLAFREGSDRDELQEYEQFRYQSLMEIYGLKDSWGDAIQVLGSVHTREDRLLVFPNVLQHRVSPFSLADKSRPGHRKLLALFLVEPFIKIPSTANIPPQQRDWWKKAMEEKGSLTQRLPVELADHVVEGVEDFPISLEEAKKLREQLMDERRNHVEGQMTLYAENGYCFFAPKSPKTTCAVGSGRNTNADGQPKAGTEPAHEYEYQEISSDEIRLLTLAPSSSSDTRIEVLIQHCKRTENPGYGAISYTWGEEGLNHSIYCDGRIIKVTKGCEDALRALRHAELPRNLWIDAVCINQADLEERTQQVAMMGEVYRRAGETFAYLGESDRSCDVYDSGTTIENSDWIALLQRPWFRRTWVIQELMLSRRMTLVVGRQMLALSDVLSLCAVRGIEVPRLLTMRSGFAHDYARRAAEVLG